jgi:pimeloyl-ACP methyl ester carboxylesterase
MSSRLEEATSLIPELHKQGADLGWPVTVLALDLPSSGYSLMIEHTDIAPLLSSQWNTGYPILEFIEEFVVAFVDRLEALKPGTTRRIAGVIGGSLGGNMTLRLAQRDVTRHPWLRNAVSWSPASSWKSFARYTDLATDQPGREYQPIRKWAVDYTRGYSQEPETVNSRHYLFYGDVAGWVVGFMGQSDHWFRQDYSCRNTDVEGALRNTQEIYNSRFRRWHWRLAMEQMIFSHWDSNNPDPLIDPDPRINPASGPARYSLIQSRLLLGAGEEDPADHGFAIYQDTRQLADAMRNRDDVETLFLVNAGHSLHDEYPQYLSGRIIDFLRSEARFIRGDTNADGRTDISDVINLLGYKFTGNGSLPCEQAGDVNDDGTLDISDAVYELSFLFLGGAPMAPPVGACGVDPTGHGLTCASFPSCQ